MLAERLVVAGMLALVVVLVARVVQRRSSADAAASAPRFGVPEKLDRTDFPDPAQPWLVVVVIRLLVTRARTNGSSEGAGGGAEEV